MSKTKSTNIMHKWQVGNRAKCITDEAGEELMGLIGRVVAVECVDAETRLWWLPEDPDYRNPCHDEDNPEESKGAFDMYPDDDDLELIEDDAYEVAWS